MGCDLCSPDTTFEVVPYLRMVVRKKYAIAGCTAKPNIAKYSTMQLEPELARTLETAFPPLEQELASRACSWEQILKILEEHGFGPSPGQKDSSAGN